MKAADGYFRGRVYSISGGISDFTVRADFSQGQKGYVITAATDLDYRGEEEDIEKDVKAAIRKSLDASGLPHFAKSISVEVEGLERGYSGGGADYI